MLLLKSDPPVGLILSAKTGSRSVLKALRDMDFVERRLGRHRICVDTVKEVRDAGGKVYVSVRNPFDTAVSWYQAVIRTTSPEENPWSQWLRKIMGRGIFPWVTPGGSWFPGAKFADGLIRHENGIESELCGILESVGLGPVKLEHFGKAVVSRPSSEYWTQDLQKLFVARFRDDFDALGYSKNAPSE